MRRDNHALMELYEPREVVKSLREQAARYHPFDWESMEEISRLHFEGYVNLRQHFKFKNSGAIVTLLEEKALELTLELPFKMTGQSPFLATEAERMAYQITLMRIVAIVVRALHTKPEAVVKL